MFMASNKTEIIDHHHHHDYSQHNQIYSHHHQDLRMMHPSSSSTPFSANNYNNNINKNGTSYDHLCEMDDQSLFLFLDGQDAHSAQNSGMTPPTLNIFPSQPMHVEPAAKASGSGLVSPRTSGSSEPYMELSNPNSDVASAPQPHRVVKREGNHSGPSSGNERPNTLDPKVLRRLAQNREAARKSRLRKKAYVQQLESSRMRLAQLEQELQRARSQGSLYLGGNSLLAGDQGVSGSTGNLNSESSVFDMEYSRWLEVEVRMGVELRKAIQDQYPERELQVLLDKCLGHYDQLMNLKSMMARSDVFHILSGMWKTPAERCFMWVGDFRPSDIIKISINQLQPLSNPQFLAVCEVQQSTAEAEVGISRGLEAFNNSLSETITSESLLNTNPNPNPNMNPYSDYMAHALTKLSSLQGFIRQADGLRHETLHRVRQILTPLQFARCLLSMVEYFHRLRSLNSIWTAHTQQE